MIEMITEMWRLGLGHYIDNHPAFWPGFWLSFWISTQACAPLLVLSLTMFLMTPLDWAVSRWHARRGKTPEV